MPSTPPKSPNAPRSALRRDPRRRLRADRNGVLIAAGIMAGMGWALLYRLVTGPVPSAFPRWLFFILLNITVTGTTLPLLWYLNQRFSRAIPVTGGILLRQGIWCGLFAVIIAWLRIIRSLTPVNGFFLGAALIAIEVFLRIRERAQYLADRVNRTE